MEMKFRIILAAVAIKSDKVTNLSLCDALSINKHAPFMKAMGSVHIKIDKTELVGKNFCPKNNVTISLE